jgi:UDP-2,3-diacylglucosamine pyrophosphatase LpxH
MQEHLGAIAANPLARPELRRSKRLGRAPLGDGGTLHGDALFLSDVHLVDPSDAQTVLFLDFLRTIRSDTSQDAPLGQVRHVFLLGDIFEFIDASSTFFRALWKEVFAVLGLLQSRGVLVYFVEGNHDFGFEYVRQLAFAKESSRDSSHWLKQWATFVGDVGLQFHHPALGRVHVRHGDDVVAAQEYLYFRGFVKSRFAGFLLRRVPSQASHHFFLWLARKSRKRGDAYELPLEKVRDDALRFVSDGEFPLPDVLIIGHIHVFIDTKINGMRMLSGPDWYQAPSYLMVSLDGSIGRYFLDDRKRVEPLRSNASTPQDSAARFK